MKRGDQVHESRHLLPMGIDPFHVLGNAPALLEAEGANIPRLRSIVSQGDRQSHGTQGDTTSYAGHDCLFRKSPVFLFHTSLYPTQPRNSSSSSAIPTPLPTPHHCSSPPQPPLSRSLVLYPPIRGGGLVFSSFARLNHQRPSVLLPESAEPVISRWDEPSTPSLRHRVWRLVFGQGLAGFENTGRDKVITEQSVGSRWTPVSFSKDLPLRNAN